MNDSRTKLLGSGSTLGLAFAAAILFSACATRLRADPGNDNRAPEVPTTLQVEAGSKVQFHAYAAGVQIYTWNGSTWGASVPSAVLYDSDGNIVGIHYAGPTWETESGSKVVGARLAGVTVDSTAIPWLLLAAKTAEGPGVLARTSYVQRVNTAGGLPPSAPGTTLGEQGRLGTGQVRR